MKLQLETKNLKAALHTVATIPGTRGLSAVSLAADSFGGLLIQRNTYLATIKVDCEAEVEEDGKCNVNFDALNSLVSTWGEKQMKVAIDKNLLRISSGKTRATLALWPAEETVRELDPIHAEAITIPSTDLAEWIKVCHGVAHKGSGRDHLRGVIFRTCMDRIALMGSDGRRIHACFGQEAFNPVLESDQVNYDPGILIGSEFVSSLERILAKEDCAARIRCDNKGAQIEVGGRSMRILVSAEIAPDLTAMLNKPEFHIKLTVEREKLLEAVTKVSPLGLGDHHAITLLCQEGIVSVEADDGKGNTLSDQLPGVITREPCAFRVNGEFLSQFLESSTLETVELCYRQDYHGLMIHEPNRTLLLLLIRDHSVPDHLNPWSVK